MAKMNVSLDDDVQRELIRLVPPGKRSEVINEALRKELSRQNREAATKRLHEVRSRTATFTAKDIVTAVRRDRTRGSG